MSLFGGTDAAIDIKVDIQIPKLQEYSGFEKLKLEREFVGLYLSGHPLQEYAPMFANFTFNTGDIAKKEKPDEEEDEAEEGENKYSEFNRMPVTMGAIITDVKKIYTRANHDEMAVLSVEDLFGACEVMVFHKVWDKVKQILVKDAVVKITGKVSVRGGTDPVILADTVEPLSRAFRDEAGDAEPSAVKKLYLRFNLSDEQIKTEVMTVLSAYSGGISVVIKDTATGQVCSPNLLVRECRAIIYELNNILGEENVVLK
jgi:DNA polymerase-3 subunit alpha